MTLTVALVAVLLTLISQTHSHPVRKSDLDLKTEQSWIWGWAWGAENTVSIVDRSPVVSFISRPAAFGAELKQPLLGYVIPLSSFTVSCSSNFTSAEIPPNLGCPPLCIPGPHEPDRGDTWIALVQRGECEFVSKVREAQRLGANGVVVGGDDPVTSGNPDTLVNMYSPGDASDITIPATFIMYSDYMQLSSLIAASDTSHSGLRTLSLLITAEYSAWEWYSPILTFIVILLLPSSLTFITLFVHRLRVARAAQLDRAPEDIVNNLPSRVWTGTAWEKDDHKELVAKTSPEGTEQQTPTDENPSTSNGAISSGGHLWFEQQVECAICLSEFVKGDRVRVLPCQHIFHLDEIDEWLIQRKKLCPVCKADVTKSANPQTPPPATADEDEARQPQPLPPPPVDSSTPTERTPLIQDTDHS